MATPWRQTELTNEELRTQVGLNLSVDFYAINTATAGDCGIYYLVEHPPSPAVGRPFIHRAVLIDGGWRAAAARIRSFLTDRAATLYLFDKGQGGRTNLTFPPFDSILITHWDRDHYQGVFELLNQHAREAFTPETADTYLSPYLKYAGGGATAPRGDRARSCIYAPYWGPGVKGKAKAQWSRQNMAFPEATQQELPLRTNPPPPNLPYLDTTFLDWVGPGTQRITQLCLLRAGLRYILGTNLFTHVRPPNYNAARNFQRPEQLALFHKGVPGPVAATDAWPALVIVGGASSDSDDAYHLDAPGVWSPKCVYDGDAGRSIAINNQILTMQTTMADFTAPSLANDSELRQGDPLEVEVQGFFSSSSSLSTLAESADGSFSAARASSGAVLSRAKKVTSAGNPRSGFVRPPVRVVDDPNTNTAAKLTNGASVITMVIWTTGQMSLYSAGDATWESEMRVVAWASQPGNKFKCVRTVKASHHGSRDSTPYELIRAFNPRRIVLMANTNAAGMPTRYGHPRFELLLWLYSWFSNTEGSRVVVDGDNTIDPLAGLITSCTFPYYLTWGDRGDGSGIGWLFKPARSTNALEAPSARPDMQDYQNSLNVMATVAAAPILNYVADYNATPVARRNDYIRKSVAQAWENLSADAPEQTHPALSASTLLPSTYSPGRADLFVQHVKVYCRPVEQSSRRQRDNAIDSYSMSIPLSMTQAQIEEYESHLIASLPAAGSTGSAGSAVSLLAPPPETSSASWPDGVTYGLSLTSSSMAVENFAIGLGGTITQPLAAGANNYRQVEMKVPEEEEKKHNPATEQPTPSLSGGGDGAGKMDTSRDPPRALASVAGVPAGAVPLAATNPAPSAPFYLIPDFLGAQFKPNSTEAVYQLPSGSTGSSFDPYSVFLSLLDQPALNVNPSGSLVESDPLRYWLLLATQVSPPSAPSGDVAVSVDFSAPSPTVSFMKLSLPSSGAQPALQFSTKTLKGNFADRANADLTLPTGGYIATHSLIALGLDLQSMGGGPSQWSLAQVLRQVNVDVDASTNQFRGPVISALLSAFGTKFDTELTLQKGMTWFSAPDSYLTVQRLEWGIDSGMLQLLQGWFTSWLPWSMDIQNLSLVARRQSQRNITEAKWTVRSTHSLLLMFDLGISGPNKITFGLDMNFSAASMSLTATLNVDPSSDHAKEGAFLDFLAWLLPSEPFSDVATIIPVLDNILVRKAEVELVQSTSATGSASISISQISIMAEYRDSSWTVPNPAGGQPLVVPLLMTYTWTRSLPQPHSASIGLWFEPAELSWFPPQLMPGHEDIYHIRPSRPAPSSLSLQALMPGSYQLPTELALDIAYLEVSLQNTTVAFTGVLVKDPNKEATNHLGIQLDTVALSASYTWKGSGDPSPQQSSYQLTLDLAFDVGPDPTQPEGGDDDAPENSTIDCRISLASRSSGQHSEQYFSLLGVISNVSLGQLARFFPGGDDDVVQSLLGHIVISSLVLDYEYDSSGIASSFAITATLTLDPVDLNLTFSRDQSGWQFDATLEAVDPDADGTVKSILQAVLGPNSQIINDVPDFVLDINLAQSSVHLSARAQNPPPPTPPGEGLKKLPTAKEQTNAITDNGSLSVCLELDIPGPEGTTLELAYLQITEKAAPGQKADTSKTKRVIKAIVAGLPWNKIPQVPVIDNLLPAFDALGFYWVSDPTWTDPSLLPGLTAAELEKLSQLSPIVYKDPTPAAPASGEGGSSPAPTGPPPIVLPAGMHFVVLDSGGQGAAGAVLDYLFDRPTPPPQPQPQPPPQPDRKQTGAAIALVSRNDTDDDNTSGGTSKASFEKKVGPFAISNVGIRYQDGGLLIYLDILANLGPINLELLGFGFEMALSVSGGVGSTLLGLIDQVPTLHLQGMGVQYNEPPVTIAGVFDDNNGTFAGGVALTIDPYSFIAVGEYGVVTQTDQAGNSSTYKTVFLFAKLDGPLLELEVITVSSICLGFGYNSSLRFPSVAQVPTFPFVQSSELGGADPLAVMQKMTTNDPNMGVISPQPGSYWLAAGLEGKLVQMLDVSAVVVLEFNPQVHMGIFARAIAQMPPPPTARESCILYAELGIVATLELAQGAFSEMAQLSPNSFVISPNCHLTGGYALCYWFPPSGHAGDFVFTLGGYHSAFKPPPHYPTVDRLAISWDLGGGLKITGQAYFAITPRTCMAGGVLNANFDQGLLHAYLSAWADALIEYHPFSMRVDIGLDVGVSFTLELLFISIDISVSIGAELTLWAAPFGGSVYVDFWVFGFTIGFGDDQNGQAVDIETFRELLANVPDSDDPTAGGPGVPSTIDKLHVLSVESGRYAEGVPPAGNETKQGDVWQVKSGGFVFRVQSRVPLHTITESTASTTWPTPFFAIPMHQTVDEPLSSTMTVKIIKDENQEADNFGISGQVLKQMPLAIWGPWDPNNHPGGDPPKNNIASQLDPSGGGTVLLLMGASFAAPPPEIALDPLIPVPVLQAASQDVFTDEDIPPGGNPGDEHPALPADVVDQAAVWRSAQPTDGAAQWTAVLNGWEAPALADPSGKGDVVGGVAALWAAAAGWAVVDASEGGVAAPTAGSGGYVNALTNQLKVLDGVEPMVWSGFGDLYMAAPLIRVHA